MLGKKIMNNVPMDVRQTTINTIMSDGKSLMVDAKKVQNRRVDVVDLCRIVSIKWLVAPLILLTECYTSFDASAA